VRGIAALLVAAAGACAVSALTQAAQDQPRPTFRTEANYIRVDVYPTKDGRPVGDLTKDDFEVIEDRTPQTIAQFERVTVRGNVPQELRREPDTVAQSRAALEDPRARVFVVFLDIGHVDVEGSHRIRQPLTDALNHLIGEDDLVAVMTPEMSALDLTFARKTITIEGFLSRHWYWGERDQMVPNDPVERNYEDCFGGQQSSAVTRELIARRREKQTLDAFEDLVRYLRGAREERKAIIVITNGWVLYRPNEALANQYGGQIPAVGVNPGTGRPQIGDAGLPGSPALSDCTRDLLQLSRLDDAEEYRRILAQANYSNTSFYPLDPRGLPVFDTPITQPLPLNVDAAVLRQRAESLRTLADNTDGLAMLNNNDLSASFRRIVADLSSYYLLGYYSTGKLDGKFHAITVRIKRPGVQVRARRGYQAALLGPNASARLSAGAAAAAPDQPAGASGDPSAAAVTALAAAMTPLAEYAREVPFRAQAAAGWKAGDAPGAFVSVAGELSGASAFDEMWRHGAVATIDLAPRDGASVASARATIAPGAHTFRVTLASSEPLAPDEYVVYVAVRPTDATLATRETVHVTIPPAPQSSGALWVRRGLSTANREVPAADLRFHRGEQARVEVPVQNAETVAARLLDRTGKALAVPVTSAVRTDADGARWITGQVAVAPLGAGDYLIELSEGTNRILAAFRVVP
jgi:VWFA-related protein